MNYKPLYHPEFLKQLKKYKSLTKQVEKTIKKILEFPYNSELLSKKKIDLRGKRSKRIDRNFRIIFTVCDECEKRNFAEYNQKDCGMFCDTNNNIIFLTFGTHEKAYKTKE